MTNRIQTNFSRIVLLLFATLLASACATGPKITQIRSDVDALATSEAQVKRRFVVLPGDKGLKQEDLQFIEFKTYVEKVLLNRGYAKADTLQDGDVVIFLSYGVGEPKTYQYSYEVPAWNGMGMYPYSWRYRYYPMMYTQHVESYVMYRRYLTLEAYDMAAYLEHRAPQQLWKVTVQSEGPTNDLRLAFPYMATAMDPYLGTNTGHMITVDVNERNALLQQLLRGNSSSIPPASVPSTTR